MKINFPKICGIAACLGFNGFSVAETTQVEAAGTSSGIEIVNAVEDSMAARNEAVSEPSDSLATTVQTGSAQSDAPVNDDLPRLLIQSNNDTLLYVKNRKMNSRKIAPTGHETERECEQECSKDCYRKCPDRCEDKCADSDDEDCNEDCFDDCYDDCEDNCEDFCEELYEDGEPRGYVSNGDSTKHIDISEIIDKSAQGLAKSRRQGYGGGGGWTPGVMGLDMEPVVNLIKQDNILGDKTFRDLHSGYTPVLMNGWMAYGGLGKGSRIGGGSWKGTIAFSSEPYGAGDSTDTSRREVAVIEVEYSHSGLLLEKSFVIGQFNMITGGMITIGNLKVKRDFFEADNPSAFSDIWEDLDDEDAAEASMLGLELHGGFTYTVLPWVHLGADASAHFSASVNGFGSGGLGSFFMASPGMRIRLILGNIG